MTMHTFNNSWDNIWTSCSTRWRQPLQANGAQLTDKYFSQPTTPMVGRARSHTWTSSSRLMFLFLFSQLCRELKFSIKHCKTASHGDLFRYLNILPVISKQLQLHLILIATCLFVATYICEYQYMVLFYLKKNIHYYYFHNEYNIN
jgi:hypothetical protein